VFHRARTRETWDGIASRLDRCARAGLHHGLYHAAPADMLNAIRDSDATRLAVVAHNPGIGSLAWSLCATPPDHPKFGIYPTGATLILEVRRRSHVRYRPRTGTGRGLRRAARVAGSDLIPFIFPKYAQA
jgi:phosphohistidine phosphatase